MLKEASGLELTNNFNLKNEVVSLTPVPRSSSPMTVEALEKARTQHSALPASKHSLELICGGSCDIGAQ